MATWDTWQGDSWIDAETNQRFMYDPTEMRTRSVDDYNGERQKAAEGFEKTNEYYSSNPQAYQKLTPEQTAYIKNFKGSADELTKYYASINPSNLNNLYGNGLSFNGDDMWWSPQQGPRHTDNGGPLSAGSFITGGLDVGEQGQSDWNEMRTGLGIMALPFVGAGVTAGLGAAGAAGAGAEVAGGAAVGGTETGITAGAAGSEFGATGATAVGGGQLAGGAGSATLAGDAAGDTLGGETLFPGESATSGAASTGSGAMPGDTSGLFPGEANPGAAESPESGSLLDYLSKGPGNNQSFAGLQPSDLMKTGLNLGIQQLLAQRQQQQAQQIQQAGNPLNDPARQPFQQQATNMVNNPQDYFTNNPFASQLAAMYKNNIIPRQLAKSGNAGEVLDRNGSQFATALGGNYNQLLQTLSGLGGFNQPNSGVGASVPLLQGSNTATNEAFRGFGGLASKSLDGIFGDVTRPQQNGSGSSGMSTWLP